MNTSARSKGLSARKTNTQSQSTNTQTTIPSLLSDPFWPPISAASKEKRIWEQGYSGWVNWLKKEAKTEFLLLPPKDEAKRIAEVYRLCFKESGGKDLSIIGDFVARNPQSVLNGSWLAELADEKGRFTQADSRGRKNRFFAEISAGFRRACTPRSWERASLPTRLRLARKYRGEKDADLKTFVDTLKINEADPKWVNEQVAAKVSELVRETPRLSEKSDRLTNLLRIGRVYEASIVVAAAAFGVRERDLQSKSS